MKPDNRQGVLWALIAAALFAGVQAMAKVAAVEFHIFQIIVFRQLVVFAASLPTIAQTFSESLHTQKPLLHSIRLAGAFIGLVCSVWAVSVLPLTTAITLMFAQVFFVALIARFFLGEQVGPHRIGAIIVGFIGVIVVMRPGVDGFLNFNAFIAIAAALGSAVALTSVRRLSQTESTATLMVYQSVVVGILAAIPLIWLWKTPDLGQLLFLLSLGLVATAAQWIGVKALRLGEASVIGNIEYTKLIYAAALGYILFREIPDVYTLIGAAIIIGSSYYIFRRERRSNT